MYLKEIVCEGIHSTRNISEPGLSHRKKGTEEEAWKLQEGHIWKDWVLPLLTRTSAG
jgi:hypothetical protein